MPLLQEVHRRRLWQVTAVYVLGSWGALAVIRAGLEMAALPVTLSDFALMIVAVGLGVVLATAYFQGGAGGTSAANSASATSESESAAGASGSSDPAGSASGGGDRPRANLSAGTGVVDRRRSGPTRWQRLFTWRHATMAGVAAWSMWGVLAVGLFLLRRWIEANA